MTVRFTRLAIGMSSRTLIIVVLLDEINTTYA